MSSLKSLLRSITPSPLLSTYHFLLAALAALWYGFPSRDLVVIGVTGTKGKSTTAELVYEILAEAGEKPALLSTIHFITPSGTEPNLFKMTMPGRFFVQHFLRQALDEGATHAVIEMTSEGVKQWRHLFIDLDALIFTNLAPEHIESHGSFEKYAAAKLKLAKLLEHSSKKKRIVVANADDAYGEKFLEANVDERIPFSLKNVEPCTADYRGSRFMWRGELFTSPLPGRFNLSNILAALSLCEALGISADTMKRALARVSRVAGRAERIERGQPFTVIVDYAHTPDSLKALYEAFSGSKICVLGNTGGGRDTWKRPVMGSIAEEHCSRVILTDEDPYDENPEAILKEMAEGFKRKPRVILDRREAIREALRLASPGESVLITGKGTDPYIMGANGKKTPWSDRAVAEEELEKLLESKGRRPYH